MRRVGYTEGMLRALPFLAALFFLVTCPACGGGGGGSSDLQRPVSIYPSGSPGPTSGNPPGGGTPTEVEQQRAIWQSSGVVNYRYTLQRTVYSGPLYTDPVVVEVRGGAVVSRTYANTGAPVTVPDAASWWPAIDGLFDLIEDARNAGAAVAQATWDPTYGFPDWASIDPNAGLADDEHSFTATGLVVLP